MFNLSYTSTPSGYKQGRGETRALLVISDFRRFVLPAMDAQWESTFWNLGERRLKTAPIVVPLLDIITLIRTSLKTSWDIWTQYDKVFRMVNVKLLHFYTQEHLVQAMRGLYTSKPSLFWDFELTNCGISARIPPEDVAAATKKRFLARLDTSIDTKRWNADKETIMAFARQQHSVHSKSAYNSVSPCDAIPSSFLAAREKRLQTGTFTEVLID